MISNKYYFIGYANGRSLPDITPGQAKKLTHLNVAFGLVNDSTVSIEHMRSHLHHIKRLRQINQDLKILLSTGGGNQLGHSAATATDKDLNKLIESTIEVIEEFDFDGVDCDWEFPCYTGIMEEKYRHTKLITGYRNELNKLEKKKDKKYWLTIAAAAGQWFIDSTELDIIHSHLDFLNLMTYDMRFNNQPTGHHTNLYEPDGAPIPFSADTSIKLLIDFGIPSKKIVMGAAFYSRKWQGVPNINNGINVEAKSPGGFGPDYTAIHHIYEKQLGFIKYWDDRAKAPWLFNGDTFISYDDPESIRYKCEYVKEHNLGGVMYWEHGYDRTGILFNTIYDALMG
jgi:chitinase